MEELFGVPMQGIMVVLLVMLGICLLAVAFIAWRRPVIFKMGMRNIPRRKAQTSLIIIGLMLATLIISAALGTGDTLNHSVKAAVLDTLGPLDIIVVHDDNPDEDANVGQAFVTTIPEDSVQLVRDAVADTGDVDGVAGILFSQAPFINTGENDPTSATSMEALSDITLGTEPVVNIAGLDQDSLDAIGGVKDNDGNDVSLANLGDNGIYLNEGAADKLNASVGDNLLFYMGNQPQTVTVVGIVPDSVITGAVEPGSPGAMLALSRLQQLTGNEGQISAVAVSNRGDSDTALALSDSVTEVLDAALAGQDLGAVPFKQQQVEIAELIGNVFVTFFIVFGLFSIGVGILLIVLIFTMLAAERRTEMGMARAIGAQRRMLIQQFLSEGAGYTLISGLVGTGLGVLAAFAIVQAFGAFVGDAFKIEAYVAPRSLVIAYCLGVVITFLAVAISSWRVSRLNVVAAVRDIPDVYVAKRNRRQLIWSIVMIVAGTVLLYTGIQSRLAAPFTIGFTLIPFGIAGILTYFGANARLVLTLAGVITLVFWLLPDDLSSRIFGTYDGDIDMFFVSGVCIVAASTLIIVQNLDAILGVVTHLGGRIKTMLPATRLAVSYPGASKGRTGMTIAMFSLIVFSLVMVAAINDNFAAAFLNDKAYGGWDVRVDVARENPIDDFEATLQQSGVDTGQIAGIGTVRFPNSGGTTVVNSDGEMAPVTISVMDQAYMEGTGLTFSARASGYDSDQAILDALANEPGVMVINQAMAGDAQAGFGGPDTRIAGTTMEGTFDPVNASVDNGSGQRQDVKVIGVIESDFSMLLGAFIGEPAGQQLFPDSGPAATSYYIHVADGVSPKALADEIEIRLLPYGAVGTDLDQQMQDDQAAQKSFMYVLQGFMGLGLIVGIAAVGVIAFRSVVERRQQIGMLRAIGFQRTTVQKAFVLESAIIVVVGVLAGAIFGLILAYNLMTSDDFTEGAGADVGFIIPWSTMLITIALSVLAALFMAWLPARQASRVIPAEALRYE